VLLLHGGDKGSQSRDIAKAQSYWKDYRAVKEAKAKEEAKKEADKKAGKKEDK
jgi:hypothetical protein